jgi:hypothetical protein
MTVNHGPDLGKKARNPRQLDRVIPLTHLLFIKSGCSGEGLGASNG